MLLRGLRKAGIDIAPYLIYIEEIMVDAAMSLDCNVQLVTGTNVEQVLGRYGSTVPAVNAEKWRRRAAAGDFGVLFSAHDELIGFTWASLRYFLGIDNRPLFVLEEGEAYSYDTFVQPDHRGRGIAGALRREMSRRLVALGGKKLYSFTLLSNAPALRFKRKLGALPVEARVRVKLFGRWFADVRLKRWIPRVPVACRAGRVRVGAGVLGG